MIELNLPAKYRYLSLVGACIRELMQSTEADAVSADLMYGLQLAVHEICNNIIEHAYGHENGGLCLVLSVRPDSRMFTADLYDNGQPFDPTSIAAPNLDEPREEGYGLFLVQQLMDEVSYDIQSGKNHWRLHKKY